MASVSHDIGVGVSRSWEKVSPRTEGLDTYGMRLFFCALFGIFLSSCAHPQAARVVRVVDGDTLVVQMGDEQEKVRIVGIDAPETVDPRKPVQCFGPEASAEMKLLASGKEVTLESKPDEDHDKYNRLLRYVFIGGKDIGAQMIREGYAYSYNYFPHPRLQEYKALEAEAKREERGLWKACPQS